MAIDFAQPPGVADLVARTTAFVREVVIPAELQVAGNAEAGGEAMRLRLQAAAKEAGVFAPHVSAEYGGLGLDMRGRAAVFEASGYSLFGPLAMNCSAPDEGNMHMLEAIASDEQKERYLRPLAVGDVRSAFAMTEPPPGVGSDPSALTTTAVRVAEGWRIDGHKWFTTGADGAAWTICMARTAGKPGTLGGATMFFVDGDNPGMKVVRHIDTLDRGLLGGHCEVLFENCVVPDSAIIGAADQGFAYAQVRLGPARMTHCMRWLGIARRAQDIALDRIAERSLFGSKLTELGMAQQMIADSEIDISASRALILNACWELDQGQPAAQTTAMAKTFVAEAVNRVVDRAVQLCGGVGISGDLLLGRYLNEVRGFRIYDGTSETHRWAISRRAVKQRRAARESEASA